MHILRQSVFTIGPVRTHKYLRRRHPGEEQLLQEIICANSYGHSKAAWIVDDSQFLPASTGPPAAAKWGQAEMSS